MDEFYRNPTGSETGDWGFESPYLEAADSACLAQTLFCGGGGSGAGGDGIRGIGEGS